MMIYYLKRHGNLILHYMGPLNKPAVFWIKLRILQSYKDHSINNKLVFFFLGPEQNFGII